MRQNIGAYTNGTNGHVTDKTDTYGDHVNLDILIVGAGFGGVYLLHKFRALGYNVKVVEAGTDLGGVWHWNTYPGGKHTGAFEA